MFYGLQRGIPIDSPDGEGHTPLMWAAFQGHEELVTFLISRHASIGAADKSGFTALHWAASRGSLLCAEELLRSGASPTVKTNAGDTPSQVAAAKRNLAVLDVINDSVKLGIPVPEVSQFDFLKLTF